MFAFKPLQKSLASVFEAWMFPANGVVENYSCYKFDGSSYTTSTVGSYTGVVYGQGNSGAFRGAAYFLGGGDSYSSGSWNRTSIRKFDKSVFSVSAYSMTSATGESGNTSISSGIYTFGGTNRTDSGNPNTRTYVSTITFFNNTANTSSAGTLPSASARRGAMTFTDSLMMLVGGTISGSTLGSVHTYNGSTVSSSLATLTTAISDLSCATTSSTQGWSFGGGTLGTPTYGVWSSIVSLTSAGVRTNTSAYLNATTILDSLAASVGGLVTIPDRPDPVYGTTTDVKTWDGTTLSSTITTLPTSVSHVHALDQSPLLGYQS